MTRSLLTLLGLAALSSSAFGVSISDYVKTGPTILINATEASGVTYNRDTGYLYVIGDEGGYIRPYTTAGAYISDQRMGLGSFQNPEGIAYMGNNTFLLTEERHQIAHQFEYIPLPYASTGPDNTPVRYYFGSFSPNEGLEGVSYDHLTNTIWGVKEKNPQLIYLMSDLGGSNTLTNPFDMSAFGLNDLADIYLLSNSLAFAGTAREWNILLLSQESKMILEVTRTGELVSSLDLSNLGPGYTSIEGITMDDNGTLYLVGEGAGSSSQSNLYVLNAVPEPSTYALMALGGLALWALRRRQQIA